MRNLFLLVKNYLLCFLGNLPRGKEKARYSVVILFLLLFAGIFISSMSSMAIMTIEVALEYEESIGAPLIAEAAIMSSALLALMCSILTIFTKASMPSKSTDENLLLSLPIKKSTIVTSKVLYHYLFDMSLIALTMIPTYVVYSYMVPGANFLIVLRGILIVLLLPLLVDGISTMLGYLIGLITRGYRFGKVLQSIIVVIVLVFFMAGYYGIMLMSENNALSTNPFFQNFPLVKWIINFSLMNESGIISILYLSLLCIFIFIIGVMIQARQLGKERHFIKSKKRSLDFRESKVSLCLFKKELSYYFSIPIYVINTLLFGIFAIIMSCVIGVMGKESILNLIQQAEMNIPNIDKMLGFLIILIIGVMIGTLCTTAPSISLEGKKIWILKAHPVSEMSIFFSKIFVNVVISSVCSLISSIALGFALGFEYFIFILIVYILISFMSSMIGILGNLFFPNFNWDNEQVPIKQGISVLIGLGFGFLGVVIPFGIGLALVLNGMKDIIVLMILIGLYIIIDLIIYCILKTKGVKLFKNL